MMTLNEAIYKVLTSQYKKEAKDAFKIVENVYRVRKSNGNFEIINDKTQKAIWISGHVFDRKKREYVPRVCVGYGHTTLKPCINFVNCLNTPTNVEYHGTTDYDPYGYKAKINKLKQTKRRIKWRTDDINRTKEKISSLQNELIMNVEFRKEAVCELRSLRKEFGLKEYR